MSDETVKWLNESCTICGNRINSWDKELDKLHEEYLEQQQSQLSLF